MSAQRTYHMPTDEEVLSEVHVPHPGAEDIEYQIAATRNEREEAFRLIYHSYMDGGLIDPNPQEMRVTPFHLLPTTEMFIATYNSRIICTVSLIGDGEMGVPMESIFPREVHERRSEGIYFGEVSCLADRRHDLKRILPVFVKLTRVMAQYARKQGMEQFLIAVHPKHARFYKRFMFFEQISDERTYPSVRNRPAVACCLDFAKADRVRPACYDGFFGIPVPPEELKPRPMSEAEQDYFLPAAEHAGNCVTIASE